MPVPLLEVIALDAVDARHAEQGGADRLELVADMASWGLTPSVETFAAVRAATTLPIRVMIRQHEGFAAGDLTELQHTARALRDADATEFVLGFLDESSEVDLDAVKTVLESIGAAPWTFHRAIDFAADRPAAWRAIQDLPGLDHVLTSGGPAGFDGLPTEARALPPTAPRILAGGGLREPHLPPLLAAGVTAFHCGTAVRPNGSWTSPIDPALVHHWRTLLDAP
ncbi:copper homeostasis protein CutC [Rhizocola hellebori]|uniref:copper homeostasis protein CutC n=1 Tax=Rhizocola hellebori TaxID=1392758 RepID=UPI001EF223BE|nr:copper homeostasis protein CutC [Rhizocola hellebori]